MDKAATEKILDYWFSLEFLSQDKYPDSWDIVNKVKIHKKNVIKGIARNKTIEDFILLNGEDIETNIYGLISREANECGMKKWGNLTFYIGKVKRERCIDCISKVLPFDPEDSNRPEKSSDKMAWVSLQLSPEGNYVEHSLSLSTIVWALNQIKSSNGNIAGVLDDMFYKEATDELEKKFFDEKNNQVPKAENKDKEEIVVSEEMQSFGASAITLKKLQELYKEIEKSYIKGNIENSDSETDSYEEIYGISFQLFKNEDTRNKREDDKYLGLNHDYYSDDIKLVLDKVKAGSLQRDLYMGKDLLKYINILNERTSNEQRTNVVYPTIQGEERYLQQINEIFSVANAPLGKWPSRFMPAFMQQMAINLAIGKGSSDLFNVNGKVFSVNGPPGTGKTTLLKEIVVNNIVERARILSQYNNPEEAFVECDFLHGDKEDSAYSKYTRHWYRLKDDSINNYSVLVTSCNNAAVENISKELPKSMLGDLKPLEDDSEELRVLLQDVVNLFDAKESDVIEITHKDDSYTDIYFTRYAQDLLDSEEAWGLVAAPLGRKSNLSNFYNKVLYNLSRDFYKSKDTAKDRVKKYKEAREAFDKQLKVVEKMRDTLRLLCDLTAERLSVYDMMISCKKDCDFVIDSCEKRIKIINESINNLKTNKVNVKKKYIYCRDAQTKIQGELQDKNTELSSAKDARKDFLEKELNIRNSMGGLFSKLFKSAKYKTAMKLADEYKNDAEEQLHMASTLEVEIDTLTRNIYHATKLADSVYSELMDIESSLKNYESKIETEESNKEDAKNKKVNAEKKYKEISKKYEDELEKYLEGSDIDTGIIIDKNFIEKLLSGDVNISTKAQVDNPWFSQRYNREREKLFAYAMRMNKEFVISSNRCRDNFNTLSQYWGLNTGDEKERIIFHKEDKEKMVPALFQTLFLLVPVMSSTFASVGSLFKDVKDTGVIGMLVVDEAGQAQPHMALGALYRSRKAVIVGDPKQVEPVVTDDLLLLKKAYNDYILKPYKEKTLSVQAFADQLNVFGTYLDNGTDYPEWVGCPLLVHRRCISPMYNISNQISYNGLMKQQTRPPKEDKIKNFICEKSQWINVIGKEKGNKNHFVEAQGKKICELLETAFSKNPEPSIYIISPFTTVVAGVKKYIKEYCRKNSTTTKIDIDYILDSDQKKVGTVHTFQGKEADEVIFLLGCDLSKDSEGAIKWVNKNIVNVAATRAKYRLYVIGDEKAWSVSSCVSEAKQIMDTFAIKEIKSILNENLSKEEEQNALLSASESLPSVTQFTTVEVESEDGIIDYSVDTNGLIQGLNEEFLRTELSEEQLDKFGFSSMKDLDNLSPKVKENLVLGMKLFFLLEPVYLINNQMDASCCAILFCKAMELQMKDCFTKGLINAFPDFKIKGFGNGREKTTLKDVHKKELTLGAFDMIIKSNGEFLGRRMKMMGQGIYDEKWWRAFETRLNYCTSRRNKCCHSGLFSWKEQSFLINDMFKEKNEDHIKGIMFESEVGKRLSTSI